MDGLERSRKEVVACRRMRQFSLCLLLIAALAFGITPASAQAALETTIDSGPAGPTNNPAPTFTFSTTDPNAVAFACAVDSEAFPSCSSPFTASALAEGSHTFSVTARDGAGNVGTAQVQSFVVDITVPVVSIDSGPPAFTSSTTATFALSGADDLSPANSLGLECRLSFQAFELCTSPKEYTALPEGQYTFRARVTDEAGNVSAAAIYTWTVDLTPPETTIDTVPSNPTNSATTKLTFSSDDPSATFECNMDAQDFAPCSSPLISGSLSDGFHIFRVRATDLAGNVDASPASSAFTVDTTPRQPVTNPPPPSPHSPQPSAEPTTVAKSFVRISKRPVRVSRKRLAPITMHCGSTKRCDGVVRLTATRLGRRLRLGSARFAIPARETAQAKVRLSERSYRLLRKLQRTKVVVTVRQRDSAGHMRTGTREILLTVR